MVVADLLRLPFASLSPLCTHASIHSLIGLAVVAPLIVELLLRVAFGDFSIAERKMVGQVNCEGEEESFLRNIFECLYPRTGMFQRHEDIVHLIHCQRLSTATAESREQRRSLWAQLGAAKTYLMYRSMGNRWCLICSRLALAKVNGFLPAIEKKGEHRDFQFYDSLLKVSASTHTHTLSRFPQG